MRRAIAWSGDRAGKVEIGAYFGSRKKFKRAKEVKNTISVR